MSRRRRTLALGTAVTALAAVASPGAIAAGGATPRRALLTSRRLWATVDVCNPRDQPDTVGVRGSMPGNGDSGDRMYMSFRLQVMAPSTQHWSELAGATAPEYLAVGSGSSSRQGGSSFVIKPVAGKPAVVLRGIVEFQWRRGSKVLARASRPTTAGHVSLAGADPAGFSAASCSIG